MLPGKFTDYYWRLSTFLAEKEVILDKAHPDHRFPEDDSLVYYTRYLEGCLVFVDGSRLRLDIPRADFVAVFSKVEELVQMGAIHLT